MRGLGSLQRLLGAGGCTQQCRAVSRGSSPFEQPATAAVGLARSRQLACLPTPVPTSTLPAGDGERAAAHLLRWSVNQRCPDPAAFTADLCDLWARECDIHSGEPPASLAACCMHAAAPALPCSWCVRAGGLAGASGRPRARCSQLHPPARAASPACLPSVLLLLPLLFTHTEAGINLDAVMKGTLAAARRHEVAIDSNYAALCVGVCVIGESAPACCPARGAHRSHACRLLVACGAPPRRAAAAAPGTPPDGRLPAALSATRLPSIHPSQWALPRAWTRRLT